MNNLKKNSLVALITAGCLVAFTGAASANSITLSKSDPGIPGSPARPPSSYNISSFFTVTVFANLMPTGGGSNQVTVSLTYDASQLTAVACAEQIGPAPFFAQIVGGGVFAPATANCGQGSPANGGLVLPGAGTVASIEQSS